MTDINGNKQQSEYNRLYGLIYKQCYIVPVSDIHMHVKAIQKGDYTFLDLKDNMRDWYQDNYIGNNDSLN